MKVNPRIVLCIFFGWITACSPNQERKTVIAVIEPSSCAGDKTIKNLALFSSAGIHASPYHIKHCVDFTNKDLQKERNFHAFKHQKQQQVEKIIEAMSSDANVIWAAKGGNGAQYTFEFFDKRKIHNHLLIGMSDTTRLQIYFAQRIGEGFRAIQGHAFQNLNNRYLHDGILSFIRAYLHQDQMAIRYPITPENDVARRPIKLSAPVIGGLLNSVFYEKHRIKEIIKNKAVFLEMHEEASPRMLFSLLNHGFFDDTQAVLIGTSTFSKKTLDAFYNALNAKGIPAFSAIPFGHGCGNNCKFVPINFPTMIAGGNNAEIIFYAADLKI